MNATLPDIASLAEAPVNLLFGSHLTIHEPARSEIVFSLTPDMLHAAGAAPGTLFFKMLDDAAFYAANSLVTDRFLPTTAFNMHFARGTGTFLRSDIGLGGLARSSGK